MPNVINDAALDLIKSYEGWEPNWYPDPAHGWKVPTVCYGHTDAAGAPYFKDTKTRTFTKEEGAAILRRDLQKYADAVSKAVKVPLNDNQFGALVSWCYNVGPGNVAKSTLIKKLNAGNYAAVPSELNKWVKAGGKTLKGLVNRRAAEGKLFVSSVSAPPRPPIPAPDDEPDPIAVNPRQPDDPGVDDSDGMVATQPNKNGNAGKALLGIIALAVVALLALLFGGQ